MQKKVPDYLLRMIDDYLSDRWVIYEGNKWSLKRDTKGVVYQHNCNDCDAIYVGETKRGINTRIEEYENNIQLVSATNSVITDHRP